MNRREFIKNISKAGIGLAAAPALIELGNNNKLSAQEAQSRLFISNHPDSAQGARVNPDLVKTMVDMGIMGFTGHGNVGDAWRSVLSGFSQNDIVSIKVNCINRALSSHPEVINAITSGLIDAGVKDNNIIIWDRTNHELTSSGYSYNKGDNGVRCFGTNETGWGYEQQVRVGGRNVRLSRILTKSDHIINVPVLKDHGMAGVTLSMKNHYGSVDNPGSLHDGECNPYIPELNNVPEIKTKTRIIVLDAILGIFSGGPGGQPQFAYNSLIFAQDPVALDYQGWKILNSERQSRGWNLPMPKHIDTAAKLGIGTSNPDNIHIETLNLKDQSVDFQSKITTQWGALKR